MSLSLESENDHTLISDLISKFSKVRPDENLTDKNICIFDGKAEILSNTDFHIRINVLPLIDLLVEIGHMGFPPIFFVRTTNILSTVCEKRGMSFLRL